LCVFALIWNLYHNSTIWVNLSRHDSPCPTIYTHTHIYHMTKWNVKRLITFTFVPNHWFICFSLLFFVFIEFYMGIFVILLLLHIGMSFVNNNKLQKCVGCFNWNLEWWEAKWNGAHVDVFIFASFNQIFK
jgi:hypothetical protein